MKDLFKEMPILMSITILLILGFVFFLIDVIAAKTTPFNGIVMDKHYKAERNSTGTGYGTTSNGGSGVIITSEHESEKFLLMVKTKSGQIFTVECDATIFYNKEIKSKIDCIAYKGFFTGCVCSMYGIK